MKNRYAGGCWQCSVLVFAGGGTLVGEPENGLRVECTTCTWLSNLFGKPDSDTREFDWLLPEPRGCRTTIPVRVVGFTRACWKCGRATVCVSGMYPQYPQPETRWIQLASATPGGLLLGSESSCSSASAGLRQPRRLRGRLLSSAATNSR